MKKYENPMLHIVSINKHDVIATSNEYVGMGSGTKATNLADAPGRRFDDWYEGY